MQRRSFLKVLSVLPGVAIARPLLDVTEAPSKTAPVFSGAERAGAEIVVSTSLGERVFAAPPEMWRADGDTIYLVGSVSFVAERALTVTGAFVRIPCFGDLRIQLLGSGLPLRMGAEETFTIQG